MSKRLIVMVSVGLVLAFLAASNPSMSLGFSESQSEAIIVVE